MSVPAPTVSTRLSITAIIIHGVALLAALEACTADSMLRARFPANVDAVKATAISATIVFGSWSVLLAIRALWRGERIWPVLLIFAALGMEAGGYYGSRTGWENQPTREELQ